MMSCWFSTKKRRRRRTIRRPSGLCLLLILGITNLAWALESTTTTTTNGEEETTDTVEYADESIIIGSSSTKDHDPSDPLSSFDLVQDSLYDPIQADPDCVEDGDEDSSTATNTTTAKSTSCYEPPTSTIETTTTTTTTTRLVDATCSYGGDDPDEQICVSTTETTTLIVDKHWGSDPTILTMRDSLKQSGAGASRSSSSSSDTHSKGSHNNNRRSTTSSRPPIFLMPGLASTRLVAWRFKACPNPLLSDIKVQEYVWLNINLMMQMSTIDVSCMRDCIALGKNQTDTDDWETGCKLRPDEGLDAISSLSPGGITSNWLVGGTNTVYAWLIQWLADNLGYDVSNIVGLPYDWRLSPDKMEDRDGFLTLTRRRIEAAVQSNGKPGIMVAHSMGNIIFRYFLEWLRVQMREEAYQRYIKQAERRAKTIAKAMQSATTTNTDDKNPSSYLPGWMNGVVSGFDEWWTSSSHSADPNNADATTTTATSTDAPTTTSTNHHVKDTGTEKHAQLWELAQMEGDDNWIEWIETHIWTYVGLSAPMLGAVNPLRAVISGENMGIPVTDEAARVMEVTFGSTHTVNPISTKEGFCDQWEADRWDEEPSINSKSKRFADARLACLDDIYTEIEYSSENRSYDPWQHFPALRTILKERGDWNSAFPMIDVVQEQCKDKEKSPCAVNETLSLGPKDAQTGRLFTDISQIWKEKDDPLVVKREQLAESFWNTKVTNILNRTWERPLIKHVIMAYGVDLPTEVGYVYRKSERESDRRKNDSPYDGIPNLETVVWENTGGRLEEERMDCGRVSITDLLTKKKPKRTNKREGIFPHSGDGSVPYMSLAWAHTWLLHAVRALRHSGKQDGPANPLDNIVISHRPKGAMEWKDGPPPTPIHLVGEKKVEESSDTGTAHPHGTKYKPEMVRYHNEGTSRTTGIQYTTTVIEAIGVEHKETTRNYDILAAVFTDVLKFMHDDL